MTGSSLNQADSSIPSSSTIQSDTRLASNLDEGSTKEESHKFQASRSQSSSGNAPNSPTKGTKRSLPFDDDGPASSRRRPSRQPSRKVLNSKKGDPPRIISNLFYGTIEFWLLVLGERSWPFLFDPVPPKTTKSENNSGQNSIDTNLSEMKPRSNRTEKSPIPEKIDSPDESEPSGAKDERDCWDEARLQLGEKRDQLCLWKVGFSDQDLDGLLESKSDIYRQLGKAVLEVLLRLAVSMSIAVDLDKTSGKMGVDGKPLLQESAHKLDKYIEEASKITSDDSTRKCDPKSHKITPAFTTATELLAKLQLDVSRLLDLSLQVKLVIYG